MGKFQGGFSVTETLQVMRPASSTTIIWRITWTGPMILKALANKMNQKHTALILGSFFKKKTSNTFLAFFWCFFCGPVLKQRHHQTSPGWKRVLCSWLMEAMLQICLDDRFWDCAGLSCGYHFLHLDVDGRLRRGSLRRETEARQCQRWTYIIWNYKW